jgi:hypothetical protein
MIDTSPNVPEICDVVLNCCWIYDFMSLIGIHAANNVFWDSLCDMKGGEL